MFVPAFERLVALVRGRVRLPANWELLHSDEQKDFKRGRFAVGDTLLDAASARPAAVSSGGRATRQRTHPPAKLLVSQGCTQCSVYAVAHCMPDIPVVPAVSL